MKLSALVFRRNNYNFRIESGEFKWNFIFKKGELACGLKRMGAKTLRDLKQKRRDSQGPILHAHGLTCAWSSVRLEKLARWVG
jgi:hypothetical protein